MPEIMIGDFVKGINDSKYNATNCKMTKGLVTAVCGNDITVKILEHTDGNAGTFDVEPQYFEVIGHQKEYNRDAVIKLLKSGSIEEIADYNLRGANMSRANLNDANMSHANMSRANLSDADMSRADMRGADMRGADMSRADMRGADMRGANMRDANMSGANLDYSCWPLWCGSLHVKVDKRIACQLAYHLCSLECDDEEFIAMRNSILSFANQFHRVEECGILKPISQPKESDQNA